MPIPISIACSQNGKTVWLKLEVEEGATVLDAIERANLAKSLPGFSLEERNVGIFGKLVTRETRLKPGDRVEVYQPIAG